MPNFQRVCIDDEIKKIYGDMLELEWLTKIIEKGSKIVNFGCNDAIEALALMWLLDPREIFIINRDISESEKYKEYLKRIIFQTQEALPYVSPENRNWWKTRETKLLKIGEYPEIVQGDLSKTINIEDNHFDLAYSSNVLYQVFDEYGNGGLKNAVREMKRVTKINGIVIVSEPNTLIPEPVSKITSEALFVKLNLILSGEGLLIERIIKLELVSTFITRKTLPICGLYNWFNNIFLQSKFIRNFKK